MNVILGIDNTRAERYQSPGRTANIRRALRNPIAVEESELQLLLVRVRRDDQGSAEFLFRRPSGQSGHADPVREAPDGCVFHLRHRQIGQSAGQTIDRKNILLSVSD